MSLKLFFCYIITMLFLLFGWTILGPKIISHNLLNEQENYLYNEARQIAGNYVSGYYASLSNPAFTKEISSLAEYTDVRILIVRKDGEIMYDTSSEKTNINLFDFEDNILSEMISHNVTLSGFIDEPIISASYPVSYNMEAHGYIVALTYMKTIYEKADDINRSYWIYVIALGILITIIYSFIYKMVPVPLKRTLTAARQLSNRNYSYDYKISSKDEFKGIHDALTCIGDDLNKTQKYQKDFIANISHDFRSPLTSIRGYTEAIMDGTIPPEMYEKYLSIIQFETDRLTKLTENLLELTRFDNNAIMLMPSTFDINKVIKQTAASFEGTCRKKHIKISLIFDQPDTNVYADMSKIQQVLYNLLDNAIKFSPNKSVVRISTYIRNDKVFVSVKDNGIGIPKESLGKIWNRFYKTDLSRGKDKTGTGLGLSIVKEIITAHNEHINVVSTIDTGTEFSFSLPMEPV